jgi:glyoxylase-like metal-dependent hydrolase (beta-lactamase superfamily II)
MMITKSFRLAAGALMVSASITALAAPTTVTMCKLDGGQVQVNDLNAFSDVQAFTGKSKLLTAPSYLIKHGNDYLLWDAGLPLKYLGAKINHTDVMSGTVAASLTSQLKSVGLSADQISYVGLSHTHFDHTGQAEQFQKATLLVGREDFDDLAKPKPQNNVDATTLRHWTSGEGKVKLVEGDVDVFGDGSVVMVSTPGHTSGHHSLLVNVEKGPFLLTGDVWNFEEQVAIHGVPPFATNRADVLASEDRLTGLAHYRNATVVIQHEPADAVKVADCGR